MLKEKNIILILTILQNLLKHEFEMFKDKTVVA